MRKTHIQKIKDKEDTGGNSLHMTAYLCSVSVVSLVCMYIISYIDNYITISSLISISSIISIYPSLLYNLSHTYTVISYTPTIIYTDYHIHWLKLPTIFYTCVHLYLLLYFYISIYLYIVTSSQMYIYTSSHRLPLFILPANLPVFLLYFFRTSL